MRDSQSELLARARECMLLARLMREDDCSDAGAYLVIDRRTREILDRVRRIRETRAGRDRKVGK